MSKLNNLLSRLDKVSRKGEGKYLACCPGHDDKSPSLSIKECDDGKILLYCFAGCGAIEIVNAMGLELSDLMPNDPQFIKGAKPPKFNKYELFDLILSEVHILYLAARQKQRLNQVDLKRVEQSMSVIDSIRREVSR